MPRANVAVMVWLPLFMDILKCRIGEPNITVGKHGYKYKNEDI
jgi:hypothetical protein